MPVKIVTDSAADLTTAQASELGVTVVPLLIRFGDDEYIDGVDLSAEQFYAKMAGSDVLPSTAAPSPGAFEKAFREAGADGSQVVCINLSSALSATMASAESAREAIGEDVDIQVVDSVSITAGQGRQVIAAAEAVAGGADANEVVRLVADLSGRTRILGALDTLDNLKKGGRIGGAQAMIGSLLSIKPIIDISSGTVEEAGKQRTRRKAMAFLRDRLFEEPELDSVAVCNGGADDLDAMLELLAPRYSRDQVTTWTIGPVIGAHGGPRVVGLAWTRPA